MLRDGVAPAPTLMRVLFTRSGAIPNVSARGETNRATAMQWGGASTAAR